MPSNPLSAAESHTTSVRLEGAEVDILLPGPSADFRAYVAAVREAGAFSDQEDALGQLASWGLAAPAGAGAPEVLAKGLRDGAVWILQSMLSMLSMLRKISELEDAQELDPGALDGYFGERTEGAVRAFQVRSAITVDGIAGPETLGALEGALSRRGVTALALRGAALPRVGIVASEPRKLLPGQDGEVANFVALCVRTGCRPVLIPPCADLAGGDGRDIAAGALAAALDGVIGPGGDDVDPAIYDEENERAEDTNYPRDRFEADFALAAMETPAFMFGICRSHQLWNAATGGSLVQDVQAEGLSHLSQRQSDFAIDGAEPFIVRGPDGAVAFENRVVLSAGSQIARVLGGADSVLTNSYHHQAVDKPGDGFAVTGTVWDDVTRRSTIEATERWNVITTQFHPEAMQREPAQRELLETVCRRARIFRMLKDGGAEGLVDRMRQLPATAFDDSDFEWVAEELAAHLGQS
ncbi:MAG: gamma-glutamyl-gamma-aminobutyrate hydrolase family protein [Polyangiaceae bacterium]|nr:gamma-glutamyl-gamma-aminobutyrate hydrolase family protein [Polyangiaceae bacterium]